VSCWDRGHRRLPSLRGGCHLPSVAGGLSPLNGPTRGPAAVVGATASGKSALALAMARADPTIELVSVDSMQVYRRMDIGTAKPTPAERAEVRHHLIDIVDPWDEFTVTAFAERARAAIDDIEARGRRPLLVGGTGLYIRAVIDELAVPGRFPHVRAELESEPDTRALHRRLTELDPVAAGRMQPANRRRIIRALEVTLGSGRPFSSFGPGLEVYPASRFQMLGIEVPFPTLAARIEDRYRRQIADGFVAEARRLLVDPRGISHTAGQALGYKELFSYLTGGCDLDEAVALAVRRTRRFARRQRSWFGRDPRVRWLRADDPADLVDPLAAELGIAGA
jgi:tRNA dimethylallyltransferase